MVILILTVRDRVDTEDIVVLSVGSVVTLAMFFLGYYSVSIISTAVCCRCSKDSIDEPLAVRQEKLIRCLFP